MVMEFGPNRPMVVDHPPDACRCSLIRDEPEVSSEETVARARPGCSQTNGSSACSILRQIRFRRSWAWLVRVSRFAQLHLRPRLRGLAHA
jgi:hypothetical protein